MNSVNPVLASPALAPLRTTARDRLRGRILTIVGCDEAEVIAPHLDAGYEGLVITGAKRHEVMKRLHLAYSELLLIAEPDSHAIIEASPERPWYLQGAEDEGLVRGPTVAEILRYQRTSGATIVLLPAGFVSVGDVQTLRAIVQASNAISSDDIVLPLFLASGWLQPQHEEFLAAVIEQSIHPVLLAFGSSTNPLGSRRKLDTYRRIMTRSEAFSWRTDLAGLDAIAHGALGAAIGTRPSSRRFTPPKDKGKAHQPQDPTPYALIPGHMHWMKTGYMRKELYTAVPAPKCGCRECNGRSIDRFSKTEAMAAARHNHAIIDAYAQELLSVSPGERPGVWRRLAQDAVVAHESTGALVGRPWNAPEDVNFFAISQT